jgi:Protein of unknown function (DUF3006)
MQKYLKNRRYNYYMEIIKASLDRFEGDFAVIYSDKDNKKFVVPRTLINSSSDSGIQQKEGTRVLLYIEDTEIIKVDINKEFTKQARRRIRNKLKRLLSREHLNK